MIGRLLDIGVALVGLVLAAPFALLTAAIVAVTLGRPVLFRQPRSGRYGTTFTLLKFRTMRPLRAGEATGDAAADARRTPMIARLLRRLRLDELPQLLNILRGDMALVGPRPLLPVTIAALGEAGRSRGEVLPGLTGWAQVHGNARLADADKLALDLWYVAHRSALLDLEIVARTVGVIVFGERPDPLAVERAHAGRRRRGG